MVDNQHELTAEEEPKTAVEKTLIGFVVLLLFASSGLLGATGVVLCWKALIWAISL